MKFGLRKRVGGFRRYNSRLFRGFPQHDLILPLLTFPSTPFLLPTDSLWHGRWRSVPGLSSGKPRNEDPPRQAHILGAQNQNFSATAFFCLTARADSPGHERGTCFRLMANERQIFFGSCARFLLGHQTYSVPAVSACLPRGGVGGDHCQHAAVPKQYPASSLQTQRGSSQWFFQGTLFPPLKAFQLRLALRSTGCVWLANWGFLRDLRGTTDAQGKRTCPRLGD